MTFKTTSNWSRGIAIVGAESSGKSTLIKQLQLHLPNIRIISGLSRRVMSESSLALQPATGLDLSQLMQFQNRISELRVELESEDASPFLEDRSSIDSFAYALASCAREDNAQEWLRYYYEDSYLHALYYYHHFFVLPSGVFPVVEDGVRSSLRFNAQMMHYLITGILVAEGLPFNIIASSSVRDRTEEILHFLYEMKFIEEL